MSGEAYVFPASFAQKRVWFLDQLIPRSAFHNIDNAIEIHRPVNAAVLEQCLNRVVRRHEGLRTSFREVDGEAVQVVLTEVTVNLPVYDLRNSHQEQRHAHALRLAAEEAQQPFDLSRAPLFRTQLLQLDEEEFLFLVTFHHIIADGWSIGLFFDELSELYDAAIEGRRPNLPVLAIQYPDFAAWQRQWISESAGEKQLRYWTEHLRDLPMLELPSDYPRPATPSFAGAIEELTFPRDLYLALQELSWHEGATLFMTLLAGFVALLVRYTGQEDIVVGTPVANRNRSELEPLIGLLLNTLVLRVNAEGCPPFRELVQRVRSVALDAYAHQDVPFEQLVKALRPEREIGRNPLYQVGFQLFGNTTGAATADSEGTPVSLLDSDPVWVTKNTANIDFALDLWETADGLWGKIDYSTDLFTAGTIRRIRNHFIQVLRAVVADPGRPIGELPLSTDAERPLAHEGRNCTPTISTDDAPLPRLFEQQVERTPDNCALVFGEHRLTYCELNDKANAVATYLQAKGLGNHSIVALCMERTPEAVAAILGVLKAGAAFLPLDRSIPDLRLISAVRNAQAAALLLDHPRRLRDLPCPLLHFEEIACGTSANDLGHFDRPRTDPDDLAYVIFTSGSSSEPKGVMVSHRSLSNHLVWMQQAFPLDSSDCMALQYSLSFDAAVYELFGPLIAGAQVIFADPGSHLDIEAFCELLLRHNVTAIDVVPSLLKALLDSPTFLRCRWLRRVNCGGETLSAHLRSRFYEHFDCELNNIYGPTEATIGATAWMGSRDDRQRAVPIGYPAANTEIYLLDPRLQPVPPGIVGEIYIGGVGVALGYCGQPDLTAERFLPNPFSTIPGARVFRSRDLGRHLPSGALEYVGRADLQVKLRGHRVELGEIENHLLDHALVSQCAVVLEEPKQEQRRLVAHVVSNPNPPEFWPSLGEYGVYDELLYDVMTHDEARNKFYRAAIQAAVPSSTVVDIGTGADAILARLCVEAGAKRVYAIELLEDAFLRAQRTVRRLGLQDKIKVIHGDSRRVQLPERVEVCVSEIFGTIASSEGVVAVLADARRFLREGGKMVPSRCSTKIAAVRLPRGLVVNPEFSEVSGQFVQTVFRQADHPFDLRICVKNLDRSSIVSDARVFESHDLNAELRPEFQSRFTLTISRDTRIDGFLLWLTIESEAGRVLDVLDTDTAWLPIFFPVFYPGIEVKKGDSIGVTAECSLSGDSTSPDYRCHGDVYRFGREPLAFDFQSPFRHSRFRTDGFYERLFADYAPTLATPASARVNPPRLPRTEQLAANLQAFLRKRLPEYMVPAAFVLHDSLPLTPGNKIDRRSLAFLRTATSAIQQYVAPGGAFEERLAAIWCDILGIERAGIHDNFFDLGGHSLIATQLVSRIRDEFQIELPLRALFETPTIAGLAQAVEDLLIESIEALSDEQAQQLAEGAP